MSGWLTGPDGGRTSILAGGALTTFGWVLALFYYDSVAIVVAVFCVIAFGTTILFAVGPTILAGAVLEGRTSEVSGMMAVGRGVF